MVVFLSHQGIPLKVFLSVFLFDKLILVTLTDPSFNSWGQISLVSPNENISHFCFILCSILVNMTALLSMNSI